jgi:hypothetical protein
MQNTTTANRTIRNRYPYWWGIRTFPFRTLAVVMGRHSSE